MNIEKVKLLNVQFFYLRNIEKHFLSFVAQIQHKDN